MTDSDDGMLSMDDDFPESEDDDAGVDDIDEEYIISMEQEMEDIKPKGAEEEHLYEVLTGDQVVELMQAIIREVNTIVEVQWHSWYDRFKRMQLCPVHLTLCYL